MRAKEGDEDHLPLITTFSILDITPTTLLRSRPSKGMGASEQMAKNFERLNVNGGASPNMLAASGAAVGAIPTGLGSGIQGSFAVPGAIQSGQQQLQQQQQQQQQPQQVPSAIAANDDVGVGYPNLASFITFNPSLPVFQAQPSLKRIVHFAIDRAIREIISPVVERSVTIAGIATRELVVKDFALEPDEIKMRKAAHFMVQCLGGSLASVTSREPLRISMIQHLRTLLLQNGFTEQTIPEQAIYIIVSDNLDLACSIVEKTASEKAIAEVDESLASSFMNRRKHREVKEENEKYLCTHLLSHTHILFFPQRTGQPFYDMAVYAASRYPSTLPESLRLKVNGLSPHQVFSDV